ncbi:MAG TPA: hypothetical protein VMC41_02160 [Candidatus Nanoarchaeia archaeon]|nr:hypothetical protein [Candidatus Nanoarchaeia archaeon]
MMAKTWAITDEQYGKLCGRDDEFRLRVRKGVIPFDAALDHLQAAFDGNMSKSQYKRKKRATLIDACGILGADRVHTPEEVCPLWRQSFPVNVLICYSNEILLQAKEANCEGAADRHLFYVPEGMSLIRQREIRGLNSSKPPYFSSGNDWWLANEEKACQEKGMAYWPKISSPAGFYLLDLKPRFPAINGWQAQEDEVAKLGGKYERAPEDVFLFAIQSIYMLTGKNVTSDWWHWGKTVDSDGHCVNVHLYGGGEAHVNGNRPDRSDGALRVSVSRKFEI